MQKKICNKTSKILPLLHDNMPRVEIAFLHAAKYLSHLFNGTRPRPVLRPEGRQFYLLFFLVLDTFCYLLFLDTFCYLLFLDPFSFPLFLDTFCYLLFLNTFCFLLFLNTFCFLLFLDTFFRFARTS